MAHGFDNKIKYGIMRIGGAPHGLVALSLGGPHWSDVESDKRGVRLETRHDMQVRARAASEAFRGCSLPLDSIPESGECDLHGVGGGMTGCDDRVESH